MLLQEWIDIGVDKGIVEIFEGDKRTFELCYSDWFLVKAKKVKGSSLDRIEVTYNKYYRDSEFAKRDVCDITEDTVLQFLTDCIMRSDSMSYKEFGRLYQIVNNVMTFCKDLSIGGAKLLDWDKVKNYVPGYGKSTDRKTEYVLSYNHVQKLFHSVIDLRIYPEKQSACLCILLNFYLGLRIGELSALTWDDIDYSGNCIYIRKTENKYYERDENGQRVGAIRYHIDTVMKTQYSYRVLPLVPEAVFVIELIRRHHMNMGYDSPYLAYDGTDTILVKSLDRTLRRLCVLADVPYFNSHLIRKTFASSLHYSGTPTRVISDLMGHSEMSTTERSYILSCSTISGDYLQFMKDSLNYFRK